MLVSSRFSEVPFDKGCFLFDLCSSERMLQCHHRHVAEGFSCPAIFCMYDSDYWADVSVRTSFLLTSMSVLPTLWAALDA